MTQLSAPSPIGAGHVVAEFDSGEPSLDGYLKDRALVNHAAGASRCFVTCRDQRVVGYYALAAASVLRRDVSAAVRRNMPEPVPVLLLSRLAVDRSEQGRGVGAGLLRDAVIRTLYVADHAGVRALLVHALHTQARDFYARYGFRPSPTDPLHLILPLTHARKTLE